MLDLSSWTVQRVTPGRMGMGCQAEMFLFVKPDHCPGWLKGSRVHGGRGERSGKTWVRDLDQGSSLITWTGYCPDPPRTYMGMSQPDRRCMSFGWIQCRSLSLVGPDRRPEKLTPPATAATPPTSTGSTIVRTLKTTARQTSKHRPEARAADARPTTPTAARTFVYLSVFLFVSSGAVVLRRRRPDMS